MVAENTEKMGMEETRPTAPVFTISSNLSNKSPDVAEPIQDITPGDRQGKGQYPRIWFIIFAMSVSYWQKTRQSSNTSTFLVFLILFLDGLLLTSIGL